MDTTELKQLMAKHFSRSSDFTPGAQYFHGEYFTAHHKDSLGDLLDGVAGESVQSFKDEIIRLKAVIRDARSAIDSMKNEADSLSEDASDLCDTLKDDAE